MRRIQPMSIYTGSVQPQTPSPLSAPMPIKRPYAFLEGTGSFPSTSGREIRPKPASIGGAYGQPSSMEQQPPRKKRGRPTKAEAQARAEAQVGSVESGPAPRPRPAEIAPAVLQAPPVVETALMGQPPPEEVRSLPTSRMDLSTILTPTAPPSAGHSSSSSGRRRRGRSTRSEPEDIPSGGTAPGAAQPEQYQSPYTRVAIETQDSPARAAVLRHREEAEPRPPPYPPGQPPEVQPPPRTTSAPDPDTT